MKKIFALLSLALSLCLLVGCVGTPVIYHSNCDCSSENSTQNGGTSAVKGELKTGLALVADISGSSNASKDKDGEGKYDITMVAVLVDNDGIIRDCIIDGIATSVKFDTAGKITTDLKTAPQTKNELGDKYGMVAYGGAVAEWDKQAEALAKFAVGKTVKQLREGAIDESGKAPKGSDLASSATIYLAGYVDAIEAAVSKAQDLGAKGGETLKMATVTDISSSKAVTAEKAGTTQLDVTATALTLKDGVITSCMIDSVQAKVNFDNKGAVTSDLKAEIKTKNELGKDYGMVAYAGAIAEWDEQAASFAKYVTGKKPDEVAKISVNESKKPTDADLVTSVTISIGDFMNLIEKAAK